MSERVLAVFAHPDDETLACGGTLAKHVAAGDVVTVLVCTDGVSARNDAGEDERRARNMAFFDACRRLGASNMVAGNVPPFPDQALETIPLGKVIGWVQAHVEIYQPTVVYTHHRGDLNRDHQIVAEAVLVATRPQYGGTVKAVYAGEVLSSTDWAFDRSFTPNVFVDISATMQAKLEALCAYRDELRPWPHPRSVTGVTVRAQSRGMTVGVPFAEAFQVVREIR